MSQTLEHSNPTQVSLEEIDISHWDLWENEAYWPYFERMRKEDPVHFTAESHYGPYWSVTKFDDIKAVDTDYETYSAEGTVTLYDHPDDFRLMNFNQMDPPKHDEHRETVAPVTAPKNIALLEEIIRERVISILDSLPIGETFNWVDKVSIEMTSQMLATLFDFPLEQRRTLVYWSEIAAVGAGGGITADERRAELMKCLETFTELWHQRANGELKPDIISMLAQGEATKDMIDRPFEFLGTLILLLVAGNDTTRNSISGGVYAFSKFPAEYDKLRKNPDLIPNMVSEIIRWQTPIAHMRRTATRDTELGGKQIKKGDKVVMWYVSGNRDEEVFENADHFIIDRPNARRHTAFGYGVHRCMGSRLAEMQLRILWEEIIKRFHRIEVVGEPVHIRSNFVKGYVELPVRLHPIK